MELETPATLAILGAGPLGIEATLYARFLGFHAVLLDPGGHAASLQAATAEGEPLDVVELSSSLGRAAIASHELDWGERPAGQIDSGMAWWELYLQPLTHTDLLVNTIQPDASLHNTPAGEAPFHVQLPGTSVEQVDVSAVIDLAGQFGKQSACFPLASVNLDLGNLVDWQSEFASGLERIEELFRALTGRPALDLYGTLDHLPGVDSDGDPRS